MSMHFTSLDERGSSFLQHAIQGKGASSENALALSHPQVSDR
jgi:hypothetical protein